MNPTAALHARGQSLWLDNITRALLASGTLGRDIDAWSVSGLTSNPTIFEHAIKAAVDVGVPAPVLTTALFERFSSRGNAGFQDRLMPAMRFEFGGHHETPATD